MLVCVYFVCPCHKHYYVTIILDGTLSFCLTECNMQFSSTPVEIVQQYINIANHIHLFYQRLTNKTVKFVAFLVCREFVDVRLLKVSVLSD